MSKERARRRAEREREAAIRTAARAAEAERRERRTARRRALARAKAGVVGRPGRQTGTLAARRRRQRSLVFAVLVALNVVVWVVRPDWAARLAALVVSILLAPVLVALLVPRRR
jgi:Flp pilus assembly protein TadB